MLVQFGMGKNVGQKMIWWIHSINPKKIFSQNVGKVVRLDKMPYCSTLQHENHDVKKQTCQSAQTSGTNIFGCYCTFVPP